jgi:GNAT superfamily N-acetyltransferase
VKKDHRIEKLRRDHPVEDFDCGNAELNRFLHRHALQSQQASAAQTYLGLVEKTIVGFYTLTVSEVDWIEAPERLKKGLGRHPVPLMLLARIAVDRRWQAKGIGSALLRDAVLRTLQAAEIAGIRAIAAHAKDETAKQFYERFDFIALPTDELHLFVLLKDIKRLIG